MSAFETSKLEELFRRLPKNSGIDPRLVEAAKSELDIIKFRSDPYNQRQKQWTKSDVEKLQDSAKEKDTEILLLKRQLQNRTGGEDRAETPARIRERYKRLYDNEWAELYDYFRAKGWNEIEIIVTLQRILRASYSFCQDVAQEQLENIEGEALYPSASWMDDNGILTRMKKKEITKEIASLARLYQRTTSKECVPALRKAFLVHVVPTFIDPTKYSDKKVERYVYLCVDITWLMCVQDPPMLLVEKIDRGADFDTEMFRKYPNSEGDKFDYLVWPALLAHRHGGPVVKGVAKPIDLRRDSVVDSRGSLAGEDRNHPRMKRNGGNSRSRNPEDWINMDTESMDRGSPRVSRKGHTPPALFVRNPTRETQPEPKSPFFNPHKTPMIDATDDVTPRSRYSTPPGEKYPNGRNLTVLWKAKRPERSAP